MAELPLYLLLGALCGAVSASFSFSTRVATGASRAPPVAGASSPACPAGLAHLPCASPPRGRPSMSPALLPQTRSTS